MTFNLYPRPIPTADFDLRPARETCEVCHWPQKFGGDRIRVFNNFSDDEQAKWTKSVLLMHIGGGNGYEGIHGAHMGPGVAIRYGHADEKRQKIPWVEYSRNGETRTFKADGYKEDGPGSLNVRTMDCMDCHNRPSHTYELAERGVNRALATGDMDRTLPFVRKVALEVLKANYATTEQSERVIPAKFKAYYEKNYPQVAASRAAAVESTAKAVLGVFSRQRVPGDEGDLGRVSRVNIGHTDFDGCFRCHDERPSTKGDAPFRRTATPATSCWRRDEADPKVLAELGLDKLAQASGDKGKPAGQVARGREAVMPLSQIVVPGRFLGEKRRRGALRRGAGEALRQPPDAHPRASAAAL